MRKQKGYWTEEKVLEHIAEVIELIGRFPVSSDLKIDLRRAISKFGGFNYFRKKLSYPIIKQKGKPKYFWNETTIIKELKEVIEKLGKFPTQKELNNMNRSDLTNIISDSGGMNKYRKLIGFDQLRHGKNYWYNWENIEFEIKKEFSDMINIGVFPSRNQLRFVFPGITRAISFFGGIKEVASRMGCTAKYIEAPDGHLLNSRSELITDIFLWKNNITHHVNGIIHPSRKFRYDFLIEDLYVEIWGLEKQENYRIIKQEKLDFYNKLNLKLISIDGSIFNSRLNDIYANLEEIFKKNDIVVTKNCIDQQAVNYCKNIGFWSYNETMSAVKLFINETGEFPTYKSLLDSKKSGLYAAICKHGGLYYFRNILGMKKPYQKG